MFKFPQLFVFIIRPTCRDVLWYGAGVCLSVRLSVRLSTKLVDTIQTEPFQLGPSNLVHLLLITRGRTLLIFKVRGQRSRSHVTHCCCKTYLKSLPLMFKFPQLFVFIRPTCRDVLWYGAGVCLSVRPSVHKACRHDTD